MWWLMKLQSALSKQLNHNVPILNAGFQDDFLLKTEVEVL